MISSPALTIDQIANAIQLEIVPALAAVELAIGSIGYKAVIPA